MTAATPSRLGQADLSGDVLALFLKVFAGEVLTTFDRAVMLKGLTRLRNIQHGKSASFPAIHNASVGYHTPGTELVGKKIAHEEVVITIDDLLVSDVFIANWDEAVNHYEVRSEYSHKIGEALAYFYDQNIARNVLRAARGSARFSGDANTAGGSVVDADGLTNASSLADSIIDAKEAMDTKNVPVDRMEVNAVLKPAQWYLLSQEPTKVLNRDIGGEGSYAKGSFSMIGGVQVRKLNAAPWGVNDTSNIDIPSDYRIDMSNTVGAVFTEAAAATVQLMGLGLEHEYDIRRQGTLMVGKYAVGHGPLLNECAVEIKTT